MNTPSTEATKRVAIITGAAEGIGRAIAQRLARDGFDLGLFDLPRAKDRLEGLAEELNKEHGTRVVCVFGDVSQEEDVKRLVEEVVQELGSLYAVSSLFNTRRLRVRADWGCVAVGVDDCECGCGDQPPSA